MAIETLYLVVPLAPLVGAAISGLLCMKLDHRIAHSVTIAGMIVATVAAYMVFSDVREGHTFNGPV